MNINALNAVNYEVNKFETRYYYIIIILLYSQIILSSNSITLFKI